MELSNEYGITAIVLTLAIPFRMIEGPFLHHQYLPLHPSTTASPANKVTEALLPQMDNHSPPSTVYQSLIHTLQVHRHALLG